ncbi:MAG: hypothetical protein H0W83_06395 [Planctomycetes bacterium]|nr:hypothetical protein [Planctomycetota bacterium]
MPIPLTIESTSAMAGPLRVVLEELKGHDLVAVDEAWLHRHGCGFADYAAFESLFVAALRTSVRKRFVTERKSDEFAIRSQDGLLGFVVISLRDLGHAIIFSREQT